MDCMPLSIRALRRLAIKSQGTVLAGGRQTCAARTWDWKAQIIAAASGQVPVLSQMQGLPFDIRVYALPQTPFSSNRLSIEMRPRAGTRSPLFVAIPWAERTKVNPSWIVIGPAGNPK